MSFSVHPQHGRTQACPEAWRKPPAGRRPSVSYSAVAVACGYRTDTLESSFTMNFVADSNGVKSFACAVVPTKDYLRTRKQRETNCNEEAMRVNS